MNLSTVEMSGTERGGCHGDTVGVDSDGDGSGGRRELSGVILVLATCVGLPASGCEDAGCNKPKFQATAMSYKNSTLNKCNQ